MVKLALGSRGSRMEKMKLKNVLIVVKDIEKSRHIILMSNM